MKGYDNMNKNTQIEIVNSKGRSLKTLFISEELWEKIGYIDYITIDSFKQVWNEYRISYRDSAYAEMQGLVNKLLK